MMELSSKLLPIPNQDTQPFWQGCAKGQLLLQHCSNCGTYRHPPSSVCHQCLSSKYEWTAASGRGTVYSFSVVYHPFGREWMNKVPYVVAIIELEEGPHILSNIFGIETDLIKVGMPVAVTFQKVSEEIALPKFKPL